MPGAARRTRPTAWRAIVAALAAVAALAGCAGGERPAEPVVGRFPSPDVGGEGVEPGICPGVVAFGGLEYGQAGGLDFEVLRGESIGTGRYWTCNPDVATAVDIVPIAGLDPVAVFVTDDLAPHLDRAYVAPRLCLIGAEQEAAAYWRCLRQPLLVGERQLFPVELSDGERDALEPGAVLPVLRRPCCSDVDTTVDVQVLAGIAPSSAVWSGSEGLLYVRPGPCLAEEGERFVPCLRTPPGEPGP
ncbi:MAG: hypothetical protein R3C15_19370 [Thermoleophilia bacterium]